MANSFKMMTRDGTIKRTDTGMFISLDDIHVREGFNKREDDERTRQADVVAWTSPNEERTCDIRWRRFDVEPGPLFSLPLSILTDA